MTTKQELLKALTKRFVQVTLDDGTVHSGYIANTNDFRDEMPPEMVLVNGLMRDVIQTGRVIDVSFPQREDTISIPVAENKERK